jgi:hypothetical protein
MPTLQPPRPRAKPLRTLRLFEVDGKLVLVIRQMTRHTAKETRYWLEALPADCGPASFSLSKFTCDGPETYEVDLVDRQCDCLGHLQWGHRTTCRHLAALNTLRELGRI